MIVEFRLRRGTAEDWANLNPVLAAGEPGFDTTFGTLKIGDGTTTWNNLIGIQGDTGGGGSGGPISWDSILGKPTVFPPSAHQHPTADIVGLTANIQNVVGAMVAAGTGISTSYSAGVLTITATGGGGGTGVTDPEVVRDTIAAALRVTGPMTLTPNDAADTITIGTTATVNSTDAALRDRSTHTGTQPESTITNLVTDLAAKADDIHTHTFADITDTSLPLSKMPSGSVIVVRHGTNAATARPAVPTGVVVNWIGSAFPSNALAGVDLLDQDV